MGGGGGNGERERERGGEGVKRKWWVSAQPPYSSQKNGRQSPRVEPVKQGDRPPDAEENPGSRYRQMLGG